jgi:hypothetical protein
MASSLGLETPTVVAKTIEVLDSLVLAGASEDSLNEGLTIWQLPALAPADTDSVNESLRSWEGLLTGNTAMSLSDVKEILRVGKVGAPESWLHACAQLEHWTVMMATVLGAGHESLRGLAPQPSPVVSDKGPGVQPAVVGGPHAALGDAVPAPPHLPRLFRERARRGAGAAP